MYRAYKDESQYGPIVLLFFSPYYFGWIYKKREKKITTSYIRFEIVIHPLKWVVNVLVLRPGGSKMGSIDRSVHPQPDSQHRSVQHAQANGQISLADENAGHLLWIDFMLEFK